MKILTVCSQGNNRSVNLAHRLKYWGHDVISIGADNTSIQTLAMLFDWADHIILAGVAAPFRGYESKQKVFLPLGEDKYPRPFNPELDLMVKEYLAANKSWLKEQQ